MQPRRHDSESTKCTCGHLAAYHNQFHGRPYPCSMNNCNCEDFMTRAEQREFAKLHGFDEEEREAG